MRLGDGPGGLPTWWRSAGSSCSGAALRFATLDLQSYRYDEAVTVVRILHPSLFDTLSAVPRSESTPPLYYLVAWLWSRPFGTGEVGLRSLSALAGTASIAVVYLGAVALPLPRRVGLIAAAMIAVSPVLIWFSQDARAYALVFLLTALSFLFFARALRTPRRGTSPLGGDLGAGDRHATTSPASWSRPRRRCCCSGRASDGGSRSASARSLAAAALLLPIALQQAENAHAGWIAKQPLPERLERAGAKLVGDDNGERARRPPAGADPARRSRPAWRSPALVLLALLADRRERRAAGIAAVGRRWRGWPRPCCSAPSAPTTSTGAT